MLLRGVIRTIKCHVASCTQEELRAESSVLLGLVEHAGSILSSCQKGRDRRTPFERLHGKKPTQEVGPFAEKVLARPISSEPFNSTRYKFGVWLGQRNNCAECFVGTAEVCSERERSGGLNIKTGGTKRQSTTRSESRGELLMARGLWTGRRHKMIPCHHHQCRGSSSAKGEKSPQQTLGLSAPLQDCYAIRSGKRAHAHSASCGARIEECLKTTREGSERIEEARC